MKKTKVCFTLKKNNKNQFFFYRLKSYTLVYITPYRRVTHRVPIPQNGGHCCSYFHRPYLSCVKQWNKHGRHPRCAQERAQLTFVIVAWIVNVSDITFDPILNLWQHKSHILTKQCQRTGNRLTIELLHLLRDNFAVHIASRSFTL